MPALNPDTQRRIENISHGAYLAGINSAITVIEKLREEAFKKAAQTDDTRSQLLFSVYTEVINSAIEAIGEWRKIYLNERAKGTGEPT